MQHFVIRGMLLTNYLCIFVSDQFCLMQLTFLKTPKPLAGYLLARWATLRAHAAILTSTVQVLQWFNRFGGQILEVEWPE